MSKQPLTLTVYLDRNELETLKCEGKVSVGELLLAGRSMQVVVAISTKSEVKQE